MSIPAIEEYLQRRRQIAAATRMAEWDKALREPPTASVEPGSGYAARRAAGEGGHGMAEPWRPAVGAQVVTAAKLTSNEYAPSGRRPGALGILISLETGWTGAMVRHDDGAEVPYAADELAPAPEVSK